MAVTVAETESGDPYFDALFDAWDNGDIATFEAAFADGALFDGRRVGSPMQTEFTEFVIATGFRTTYRDCVHISPTCGTCHIIWADDFHGPGGVTAPAHVRVFFDDDHMITLYESGIQTSDMQSFELAFVTFIDTLHPEMSDDGYLLAHPHRSIEALERAIALVPEFLEVSDTYPLDEPPDVADPVHTGSVDGVDVFNAAEGQMALVAWALGRYHAGGLAPPPVSHVTFPPTAGCLHDVSGMTYHDDTSGHIDVCLPAALIEPTDLPLTARRTILHELGHLWTVGHTNEATRQRFMDHLGLPAWTGVTWGLAGSEAAAEILAWGLIDEPVDVRVPGTSCDERCTAFEILTGAPPPQRSCEGS